MSVCLGPVVILEMVDGVFFFRCASLLLVRFACCCSCLRSAGEPVKNSVCARLSLSARNCFCLLDCWPSVLAVVCRWYRYMLGVGTGVTAFPAFVSFRLLLVRAREASHSFPLAIIFIFVTSARH